MVRFTREAISSGIMIVADQPWLPYSEKNSYTKKHLNRKDDWGGEREFS